ncbi:MAG: ABC transporter ATP-binding protein [Sedimentisphaerales bacterium]|nr:ABC transporter ATP-binding protein [Sedimentisphaerales bacterium]
MNESSNNLIILDNVSRFYGEVLGINRVTLSLKPGITSLVGPNGAGKTTLMNLITGLIRPSRGRISVLGVSPSEPQKLFRLVGYATQFDSFPKGLSGYQFIYSFLKLSGYKPSKCKEMTLSVIEQVGLSDVAQRKVAAYSKGMRQRIRLAQAIAHDPRVIVLDEPLNGLDPLVRAETIALFRRYADEGRHVIISSHVMHEVDMISDEVVFISGGYVIAEGQIQNVRNEIKQERPLQMLVRCKKPAALASRAFEQDNVVEARILTEGDAVLIKTRDVDQFCKSLNYLAMEGIDIESMAPIDDDANSVYEYLIGDEEASK